MSNTPYTREILEILKDNLAALEWAITQLQKRVISTRELEQAAEQTRTLLRRVRGSAQPIGVCDRHHRFF